MVVVENEGDRNAKQFVCGARPLLSRLPDPVCLLNGSSAMFPLIMTSMKVKNVRCGFSWRQLTPRHHTGGCFINDGGENHQLVLNVIRLHLGGWFDGSGLTDWGCF